MATANSEMPTNGYSGQRSALMSAGGVGLGASTLSMRAKAARKRKVNSRHNSNFHAGFVPVDEDRLQRSGIRGRKRYFLYCLVGTLMAVAFLNLAVTAWLLYILGLTHHGLSSVEMLSRDGENLMRVLTDARLDTISVDNAMIGARFDSALDMQTEDSAVLVETTARDKRSSLTVEGNTVTLTTREFCIRPSNSVGGVSANLVSIASHNIINNLSVEDNITVEQIQEGIKYNDLSIESTTDNTAIFGHGGIEVATPKQIQVTAKSDLVSLKAQSSIHLDGSRGVFVRFPQLRKLQAQEGQTFKVCICDTGRIFVVESKFSCDISGSKVKKFCGNKTSLKQATNKSSKNVFF